MSTTRQLKTLLKLRRLKEVKQQRVVSEARQSNQTLRGVSRQLAQYREEYSQVNHRDDYRDVARSSKSGYSSLDSSIIDDRLSAIRRLQTATQFMLKLNRAEQEQQRKEVESLEKLEAERSKLKSIVAESHAVDVLLDTREKLIADKEVKREESESLDIWNSTQRRQ